MTARAACIAILVAGFFGILGAVTLPATSNCLIPETIPTGVCADR
jgi:hypothetical protein